MKQRLVGACVLVLIVVWLVPELFENEEPEEPPVKVVATDTEEFSSRIVPLEEPDEEVTQANSDATALSEASVSESENESREPEPGPESKTHEPVSQPTLVVEEEEISTAVVTVTALADEPAGQIPEAAAILPIPPAQATRKGHPRQR